MKKQTNMIRQGDVLLKRVDAPKNIAQYAKQPANRHGKLVLAQGESTLHEHTVDETAAELIALGERRLLHVTAPAATLKTTHIHTGSPLPRHKPQELGDGYYEVVRQRELTTGDIRKTRIVAD